MTDFLEPLRSWQAKLLKDPKKQPAVTEQERTSPAGMPMDTMAGSRFYTRKTMKFAVEIVIQDANGNSRTVTGRGHDISELGLLVEASEAVEAGVPVYVHAKSLHVMESAHVRHCQQRGSQYRIGIEFENPLRRSF
jgi:PilZ domain